MELFASPLACSLASHIAVIEADLPVKVRFVENKKTDDGGDFFAVSPYGYVPALRLDDGRILNEGASVLQYLADRKPEAGLAPAWGTAERYQLIRYAALSRHRGAQARLLQHLLEHGVARGEGGRDCPTRADAFGDRQAFGAARDAGRRRVHRR